MMEFFEMLNQLTGLRVVGYAIIAILIIAATLNGIVDIIRAFRDKK